MSVVLGIDVSSFAIDLVRLDENSNAATWRRVTLEGPTALARLRSLPRVMPRWPWYEDVYLAAIEAPYSRGQSGTLAKLSRVFGAVCACIPPSQEVWEVSPGDWRKELGLPGNASKDECGFRVVQLSQSWDDIHKWPQDALDAYAVAYYARQVNQRGVERRLPIGG